MSSLFLGRQTAADMLGISLHQFDRAIVLVGLEPIVLPGTLGKRYVWLRRAIEASKKDILAQTGQVGRCKTKHPRLSRGPGGGSTAR